MSQESLLIRTHLVTTFNQTAHNFPQALVLHKPNSSGTQFYQFKVAAAPETHGLTILILLIEMYPYGANLIYF